MVTVRFFLDNKETKLNAIFQQNDINGINDINGTSIIVKQLELGDFQIHLDDELKCIIERKSISDLEASVKDGRWREQKSRIRGSLPGIPLIYIIEGELPKKMLSDDTQIKKMLNGCIIGSAIRDEIPFMYTKSIEETHQLLVAIMKRVVKDPAKYFSDKSKTLDCSNQECRVAATKTKKIDNIDTRTCYLMQLASIPRISYKKAQQIAEFTNTSSMFELLKVLSESKSSKQAFAECNGIGPVLAQNIFEYCGIHSVK
jgi:ERCC4-type nuclease